MRFLDPSAFALVCLVPALVLLYFLKLKRRRAVVPSLLIWRNVAADPRANALFQRLRRRSLLLLQLLLLLLLAVAAAGPYWPLRFVPGKSLIVILDRSPTMKAVESDGASRFARARTRAHELISHLGGDEEMLLIAAGPGAVVTVPFTRDRALLHHAVDAMAPSDAPADLGAALATAQALVRPRAHAGIVVLSDLAGRRLSDPPTHGAIAYEVIGERGDNVAITALAVRPRATSAFDHQALVSVTNFADVEAIVGLEVYLDAELVLTDTVRLAPGAADGRVLDLPADARGVLEARILGGDALATDDVARAVVLPLRPTRVAVIGKLDPWLGRALAVDPATTVVAAAAGGEAVAADVMVLVGTAPSLPLTRPVLALGAAPAPAALAVLGPLVSGPVITSFRRDHAVMVHVELANLGIAQARAVTPPAGAVVLAESSAGPLLVAGESAGGRYVILGLDPLESDFPLRVAFPVFIQNTLRWLRGADEGGVATLAGEPLSLAVPASVARLELRAPDGGTRVLPAAYGGRVLVTDLDDAGIWRVTGDGFEHAFAVNAGSEAGSRVAPGRAPERRAEPAAEAQAVLTGRDLVPWVLITLVALTLFEWQAYHRRLLG